MGFDRKRDAMVKHQIKGYGVRDPLVLDAMRSVQREEFVPASLKARAYDDTPLPVAEGQTISQPYVVALMTELLELRGDETVLEIGTGSGYQTAILCSIVKQVCSVEIIPSLGESARETLDRLGYRNVELRVGDGAEGWPERAPFRHIIVTAAPPKLPDGLVEQLADGGRLVVPLGLWEQELVVVSRSGGKLERRTVLPVRFVPMTGKAQG